MAAEPASTTTGTLPWTEDATARLRELWCGEGLTASAIAKDLSARAGVPLSRNAVIGKLHRLGLSEADRPRKPEPEPEALPPAAPDPVEHLPFQPPAARARPAKAAAAAPQLPGVGLFEVRLFGCRWPVSDSPNFRFCGEPFDPANTYSWCPAHMEQGIDQRIRSQARRDNASAAKLRTGKRAA